MMTLLAALAAIAALAVAMPRMSGPPPQMRAAPRRFASPIDTMRRAKLEPIHQPLYSTFLFDAAQAPAQANFFQYAVGGTVATNAAAATNATLLHTNMPTAAFLPSPKMFLVTGIRLIPVESNSGFSDVLADTGAVTVAGPSFTGQDVNLLEDLVRIIYGSVFKFFVGTKDYLVCPSWNVPANTGIQGEASNVVGYGATPTAPSTTQKIVTFHSAGRYFSLPAFPTMIVPQQNFTATLEFPQATRPTIGAARAVVTVLDGILGREVQ